MPPAESAFHYADRFTFFQLVFLAIVARITSDRLSIAKGTLAGYVAGGLVLPAYFLHRFMSAADLAMLVEAFVRSLLVAQIAAGVVSVVTTAVTKISTWLRSIRGEFRMRQVQKECERVRRELQNKPPPPPRTPPPPPPTAAERMQKLADKAREEYEAEIKALDSLPLDEDEREVLLLRAKRNMLRKLKEGN